LRLDIQHLRILFDQPPGHSHGVGSQGYLQVEGATQTVGSLDALQLHQLGRPAGVIEGDRLAAQGLLEVAPIRPGAQPGAAPVGVSPTDEDCRKPARLIDSFQVPLLALRDRREWQDVTVDFLRFE